MIWIFPAVVLVLFVSVMILALSSAPTPESPVNPAELKQIVDELFQFAAATVKNPFVAMALGIANHIIDGLIDQFLKAKAAK